MSTKPAVFSPEWAAAVNTALEAYGYAPGTVSEFSFNARIEFSSGGYAGRSVVVSVGDNTLRFAPDHPDVDAVVSFRTEAWQEPFRWEAQPEWVQSVLRDGSLAISGDRAKVAFLLEGLVRSPSPELAAALNTHVG